MLFFENESSFGDEGPGWATALPAAPTGLATLGALAVAFQAVIWTYSGYPDAAKIPAQAGTTRMRAARRDRGFRSITISTSWSRAVNNLISRSTEKPESL